MSDEKIHQVVVDQMCRAFLLLTADLFRNGGRVGGTYRDEDGYLRYEPVKNADPDT